MSAALAYTASVTIVSCAQCGAPIALANESQLRASHQDFHCPNGHSNVFKGKSDAELAREELAKEKQRREMAEREVEMERQQAETARKAAAIALSKAAAKLKRHETRTSNGVCTFCHRSFTNLRRHMQTKHPEVQS